MAQTPGITVRLPDGKPFVMYTPSDKQRDFHDSEVAKLCAIGDRGGGKSVMLRMDAHMRALSCPGANLILVRKTYKDLIKSHVFFQGLPWGSLKKEMELLGGVFNKTDYICHYPNGSKLFLSYVGHESDAMNLLSAEFLAAYFDELSTIPWDFFTKLCASNRVPSSSNWKAVIRAATNPLGESTPEIMSHFVTHQIDEYADEQDYDPKQWGYLKIGMDDNPHIDSVQYRKDLISLNLPEHVKQAWLYGEYVDEAALFTFHPTREGKPYHVIPECNISELVKKARIYRVYDHGYKPDPAYCAWIAHLGDRYIVFHEKLWFETVIADIAEEIKEIDQALGINHVVACYCDPSIDIKTGQDIRTIKDVAEQHGVYMENSINNREQFAAAVHSALAEEAGPGLPRLQIYANGSRQGCPYLVKALPLQRYNPKHPLAMADQKHDHPVVALAYFLISHASDERHPYKEHKIKPWMKPKNAENGALGSHNVRSPR